MNITTGQHVRVTLLTDVIATDDEALDALTERARREGRGSFPVPKKVVATVGTVYDGIVSDAEDGFFDLNFDNGEALGFYANDRTIRIDVLPA